MSFAQISKKRFALPLLIWGVFALIFILLSSKQYVAVDGASRCLDVYYSQKLFIHSNNHMLYPVNVFFWHKLLGIFGIHANDPIEYLRLTQAMNAVAAAGCLAIMFCLIQAATSAPGVSLWATIGYGFSNAFFSHATNSAEPVAGLWLSFLSIGGIALALRKNQSWLLIVSGTLFALAMATYQSMVLISPAAAVLLLLWPLTKGDAESQQNIRLNIGGVRRLSLVTLGGIIGVAAIYGTAYYYTGTRHSGEMIKRFITIEGGNDIYGGITISKLVVTPFGLTNSIAPVLWDFTGAKVFLQQNGLGFRLIAILSLLLATLTFLALTLYRMLKARVTFKA